MSGFQDRHDDDDDPPFFSRGNSSDVNSKILLIAIISLSVVVVVVTMLHVYARYILRRQARRRVALQGVGFVVPIQSLKSGLEPKVIASLPVLMYRDMNHEQGLSPECTVCLGVFEDTQMIRTLPNCKHHFHVECIDRWLGSHSSCPICRHEVEPCAAILPLPREPSTRLGVLGVGTPSAPPLEQTSYLDREGMILEERIQSSAKVNGTNLRLSSFRRMLSMDRSSRRVNSCTQDNEPDEDLERQ
uniref:RING-H2 finger protein ATL40-like n=1 Tax=Erigeron canadensis TaxID=72917 RepID=UPI001CB9A403|nr:RING-H2 finger protein ATL40-like [Erigeron canadensis]